MATRLDSMPRPGLALGQYPETHGNRSERLDALFYRATQSISSRWNSRLGRFNNAVAKINEAGLTLSDMTDYELNRYLAELRLRLVYDAWDERHAVSAFAAIREMSGRVLGMYHFESQLLGGWAMFRGNLAEMQTGEGKTLAAALPAATAAMGGVPVHIITANDFLAARDAELMSPLYEALGLTVGVVGEGMDFDSRRTAYACDITYCTNKQVAFDYLRDRVERGSAKSKLHLDLENLREGPARRTKLMLRGLCFAIVDEADSVLIDEARTPLVLSRTLDSNVAMHAIYHQALCHTEELIAEDHFNVCMQKRLVTLTARGLDLLNERALPDLPAWNAIIRREEIVVQALSARYLYIRDRDYVVRNGKVQIIDGNTGRVMPDRSWQHGLQQLIEAKEGCEFSNNRETLARLSYQSFFRRYLKIAGMTGTAREVEHELSSVYGLNVVRIPTHQASQRLAMPERIYADAEDACDAVVESAGNHAALARPVLIGTRSVLQSEQLAQRMAAAGLHAHVLNARQDHDEASMVARAGRAGRITVTTNMAGRGTDIRLGPGVKEAGGLHVIVFERNDIARIDRQLYGRCARQGDPGSYQIIASLEDEILTHHCSSTLLTLLHRLSTSPLRQLTSGLVSKVLNSVQRRIERQHKCARLQLEQEDERLSTLLSFTGAAE